MELKITIEAEGINPVVFKVDIPIEKSVENKIDKHDCVTRWFDSNSLGWIQNADLNKAFLEQQESFCDYKLRSKGYLFLNEAYDCLGLSRTAYGQKAGWVYQSDSDIKDIVSFGINSDRNKDFNEGIECDAFLEFNVRDDILKYL